MSSNLRDRIAGAVLFATAVVWTGLVWWTIPISQDAAVGPRAFPLWFGIALAVLSLIMIAQTFVGIATSSAEPDQAPQHLRGEAWCVIATIGLKAGYASVLEKLGFLPATMVFIAIVMWLLLRITKPLLVFGMSVGLSIGSYILFANLLGTYLPPGTWITLHF